MIENLSSNTDASQGNALLKPHRTYGKGDDGMVSKELAPFYDAVGKLAAWPSKKRLSSLAIKDMAGSFEVDRKYSEKQVNEILESLHTFGDMCLLRRELIIQGYLSRTADGSEYWKEIGKAIL